ncbi:MAG: hypothetical protein CVU51_05910 [Deltaproteobacteria bacterium HGW-Deltaproteobacteria-1]|nr:MAG: hypothetical protein CVU51_05910 [Deltaproteobacteria bacterium HGW-Deltaproteobacteria-1]
MFQVITAIFSDSWTHVWKPVVILKKTFSFIYSTFFSSQLTFFIITLSLKQTKKFLAAFPEALCCSLLEINFRRDVIGSLS